MDRGFESTSRDAGDIFVVPEPVTIPNASPGRSRDLRSSLGLPQETFLISGGGSGIWRKGVDLFVQLAVLMQRYDLTLRDVAFVWLGPVPDAESIIWLNLMSTYGEVKRNVYWLGEVENPIDYLAASDAFFMSSREDPMPLIAIEAASVGVPIVCFEGAGGTADWVKAANCGVVVPYLDVKAACEVFLGLSRSNELRHQLGAYGREYCSNYFSVEKVGREIESVIRAVTA